MAERETLVAPGPDVVFRTRLSDGSFELQQCAGCGKFVFYPRVICPSCGSAELAWKPASGIGTVYSYTVVRQKPEQGGDYNIALIDLAEGVRMMSTVRGVPLSELRVGMPVVARIEEIGAQAAVTFERG